MVNVTVWPEIRLSLASRRISFSTDSCELFATIVAGAALIADLPPSGFVLSAVSFTITGATANAFPFSTIVILALPDLVPVSVAL